MKNLIVAAVTMGAAIHMSAAPAVKSYPANDASAVRIVGRTATNPDDGSVTFDWSGVYAETVLDGTALSLRLSDSGKSYFDVSVDGKPAGKIDAVAADTVVTVVRNLPRGKHTVSIRKRTEGETGKTTFHEFILPKGGTLTATQPRGRHIEFIGNSLSAGYGTEGKDRSDPFLAETENCNIAYSTIIPRFFDADYTIIAHSGRGVVRNYGDPLRRSEVTMKHKFLQTLDMDTASRWSFDSYRPDLVIINLGSNDFSTEPHPYRDEFVGAYMELLGEVKDKYGEDIEVLCVMPYAMADNLQPFLDEIMMRANSPHVHFIRMPVDYINSTTDRGSAWHPNATGQRKMAMLILPYVSTIMGWEFPEKIVE